jgi:hypothetical protein
VRPDIVDDRKERIMLTTELQQAGLNNIFDKMAKLNHEHISIAIEKFQGENETDVMQENMDSYFHMEPTALLDSLLIETQNTPAYSNVHNILCYLLKILDNPEKR